MDVLTMLFRQVGAKRAITVAIAVAALLAAMLAAVPLLNRGNASRLEPQEVASTAGERGAERRAIEARRTELTARAIMPSSALACLDALAGEPVERACEQAVFASPASVAAATSYAAARLRLLADGVAYARRLDPSYEAGLGDLRIAVENDSYGIYAHILTREGCTPERCAAFDLLRDTATLKVHMQQRLYATYVAQHRDRWSPATLPAAAAPVTATPESATTSALGATPTDTTAAAPSSSVASTPPPIPRARPTTETSAPAAPAAEVAPANAQIPAAWARGVVPPAASILPNIEFPSATSIPPVSIMAAEPKLPPPEAAPAAPSTAPKGSPRPQ